MIAFPNRVACIQITRSHQVSYSTSMVFTLLYICICYLEIGVHTQYSKLRNTYLIINRPLSYHNCCSTLKHLQPVLLTLYINATFHIHCLAVSTLPPHNALQKVAEIENSKRLSPCGTHEDTDLCIGAGLLPISPRLVTRTETREFIETAKLLPDYMGHNSTKIQTKPSK